MVMKAPTQPKTFTIAAGEFKAGCLKLMDEAVVTQRSFAITKRGKRVGKSVPEPPEQSPFRSLFGRSPHLRVPCEAEWRNLKDPGFAALRPQPNMSIQEIPVHFLGPLRLPER